MEEVRFSNFITRGFEKGDDDEKRVFKGHISAEVVDRQNEYIAQNEIMKKMDLYMKLTRGVSEVHSNRIVGQIDKYEKSEIQGHPSVYVEGHVFKQDGVTLYDQVWEKVKKGEYAGLSMGGASHQREQIVKDGKIAVELKKLEIYEIALCQTPANPLAIIDYVNQFAKANGLSESMIRKSGDRSYIQCNSIECVITKADMTMPSPTEKMYKCGSCGKEYGQPFEKCASCGSSMMKSIEKGDGMNSDLDRDMNNENDGKPHAKTSPEYTLKIQIDDSDITKLTDSIRKAIWEQSGKDKDNKDYKELGDTKAKEILDNVKPKDEGNENELIKEMNLSILKTSLI